jgi:hypothetical protein
MGKGGGEVCESIWRRLPGSLSTKIALAALLVACVGLLLWCVVFPAVDAWLPSPGVAIESHRQQHCCTWVQPYTAN